MTAVADLKVKYLKQLLYDLSATWHISITDLWSYMQQLEEGGELPEELLKMEVKVDSTGSLVDAKEVWILKQYVLGEGWRR